LRARMARTAACPVLVSRSLTTRPSPRLASASRADQPVSTSGASACSTSAETSVRGEGTGSGPPGCHQLRADKRARTLERGQAHVPDWVGARPHKHVVEEPLDGADQEVAHGDAQFTDEVVLTPFLAVLVVVPQGCQLAAQRADGGKPTPMAQARTVGCRRSRPRTALPASACDRKRSIRGICGHDHPGPGMAESAPCPLIAAGFCERAGGS
jgi:hypothetical protein